MMQFSAFQTLSESWMWVKRGTELQWGGSGGLVDFFGGLFNIFGERRRRRRCYQVTLAIAAGCAAHLTLPKLL